MDDSEQRRARSMTVNVAESQACVQVETSTGRQLQIDPRGPFRLDLTAWALRRRSHNAVDRWDAGTYERVVSLDGAPVALSVTQVAGPDAPRLSIVLAGGRIDQPAGALARSALDRLLGLSVDLSSFAAMAAPDPLLGPLAARLRGLKPPRFPTVFEALVNGVACQQLSLAVGIHLLNRLAADRGRAISDDPNCPRAFPEPKDLAPLEPVDHGRPASGDLVDSIITGKHERVFRSASRFRPTTSRAAASSTGSTAISESSCSELAWAWAWGPIVAFERHCH